MRARMEICWRLEVVSPLGRVRCIESAEAILKRDGVWDSPIPYLLLSAYDCPYRDSSISH